jgi:hypothetical protein
MKKIRQQIYLEVQCTYFYLSSNFVHILDVVDYRLNNYLNILDIFCSS